MNRREIDEIKTQIDDLSERLGNITGETADMAKEKAKEYAELAKNKAQEKMEMAKEKAKEVNRYAHEHPWTWMAVGIGVGLLLGAIAGKKSRHHY